MKRVFGDSFYFIALLNARDFHHGRACEVTREVRGAIVTTRWVIAEVGNALSGLCARSSFVLFLEGLERQSRVAVLPASDVLFERGAALFRARLDKEWSLTDCISFEAMRAENLKEAAHRRSSFRASRLHIADGIAWVTPAYLPNEEATALARSRAARTSIFTSGGHLGECRTRRQQPAG